MLTGNGPATGWQDRRLQRQQVGQTGGGVGIEARRRHPAQQCPLLVDTLCDALCTAFREALFTALPEPLLGLFGDPFDQRHALLQRPHQRHRLSRRRQPFGYLMDPIHDPRHSSSAPRFGNQRWNACTARIISSGVPHCSSRTTTRRNLR